MSPYFDVSAFELFRASACFFQLEKCMAVSRHHRQCLAGRGPHVAPVVTTTDSMPPEVSGREVVVPPNLVDPSVVGTAWTTVLLATWWMSEQ